MSTEAWSKGGVDTPENLQVLCRSCNSSKHDRLAAADTQGVQ